MAFGLWRIVSRRDVADLRREVEHLTAQIDRLRLDVLALSKRLEREVEASETTAAALLERIDMRRART